MSGKTSSAIDKPRKPDVGINLCPDGNQVDLDIEGTTLNVTKTSFNMTIGRFSISLNNKDNKNTNDSSLNEITRTEIRTTTQTAIFVVSEAKQNPLFVVMEEFSTCVTAKLPLTEGVRRADAHLVDIRSTGQDSFSTLTAQDNSLFLAVDSDGDVKVLNRNDNNEDGNGNQQFQQQSVDNHDVRFFVESGGERRYLRVRDDGSLDTVAESDISNEDEETRFVVQVA